MSVDVADTMLRLVLGLAVVMVLAVFLMKQMRSPVQTLQEAGIGVPVKQLKPATARQDLTKQIGGIEAQSRASMERTLQGAQ